jgi:Ca2+-binding RTX toxin-like protein
MRHRQTWSWAGLLALAMLGIAPSGSGAAPVLADSLAPACLGARATVVGTAGSDTLVGTAGDDVIVALGGADVVRGRGGDDRICAGPGDDLLLGGGGADVLDGGNGDDALHGGRDGWLTMSSGRRLLLGDILKPRAGDDLVDGGQDPRQRWRPRPDRDADQRYYPDSIDFSRSPVPVDVRLAGPGARGRATGQGRDSIVGQRVLEVVGSLHDDHLVGGPGSDVLRGRAGADVLSGRGGDDQLDDGNPQDPEEERWSPTTDVDRLDGGAGRDLLTSSWGPDLVRAGGGADHVDMVVGACGRLDGGDGADRLGMSATQRAVAELDIARGTLSGGLDGAPCTTVSGFEEYLPTGYTMFVVRGTDSDDHIGAAPWWDSGIGSASQDHARLVADLGPGDDVVQGSGGSDVIDAGPGTDLVSGGGGTDVCLGAEDAKHCEQSTLPPGPTTCDGAEATILAGVAGGPLAGTPGDDVIVGSDVADRIDGMGGNDTICAGDGADVIRGGTGGDRLLGGPDGVLRAENGSNNAILGAIGDALLPGPGADQVDPGDDPRQDQVDPPIADLFDVVPDVVDYTDSLLGIAVDLTSVSGAVQVHVADETDSVVFPSGAMLRGSLHADHITGSAGDDRVVGMGGGDTILAGAGNDRVDGEGTCGWYDSSCAPKSPPNTLDGGAGNDWMTTQASAASTVLGGEGDDSVVVVMDVPGRPSVDGGAGNDSLSLDYEQPDRTASLQPGTVDLGAGTLTWAGPSNTRAHLSLFEDLRLDRDAQWVVYGSSGPDSIWGASRVWSRGGDDFVSGTFGRDIIDAGPGHDEVWAYDGLDTCLHAEVTSSCEVRAVD